MAKPKPLQVGDIVSGGDGLRGVVTKVEFNCGAHGPVRCTWTGGYSVPSLTEHVRYLRDHSCATPR
jgi:hypothetical protein